MEQVIGFFDEQATYAEKITRYINERKDIGCFAVTFRETEELLSFCKRKKLCSLVISEGKKDELAKVADGLSVGIQLWQLCEEPTAEESKLFRYQKASELVHCLLAKVQNRETQCISELFTVFSPESAALAAEYARSLAKKLSGKGRTLFLAWDGFLGLGRKNEKETEQPSLSELLYFIRKDRVQAKKLFEGIRQKNGIEYFCGVDYSADLWQYSAEEMQELLLCCKEYGGYQHVVFLAGMFHEGITAVMNQSSRIYLVCSETEEGKNRKKEFFRQMKYAGEQEILIRTEEAKG